MIFCWPGHKNYLLNQQLAFQGRCPQGDILAFVEAVSFDLEIFGIVETVVTAF